MNTFKKEERLCSEKVIDRIFNDGKVVDKYPLKALWIEAPEQGKYPMQLAIIVPKRNFKKATERNLIKRRIREAFRINKHLIFAELTHTNKRIYAVIIYISKEQLPYAIMEKSLIDLLAKLSVAMNTYKV